MLQLENSLPVPPFTSLREVPTGVFLPKHVPAISCRFRVRIPVAPLSASTEGTDLGQRATSSEPSLPPTDGNAPDSSSVATQVSFLTKQRRKPFLLLSLSIRLSRAPNGFRSSGALCCVSFSLAFRPDKP